jgi:hypothetical protein
LLIGIALLGVGPPASAEVTISGIYDNACSGRPDTFVIKFYQDGAGRDIPLRCGSSLSDWGYRGINASRFDGFDSFANAAIDITLEQGQRNNQGGGIYLYVYAGQQVIVDTNTAPGGGQYGVTQWFEASPAK